MAESDPFRYVPASIKDAIPEPCASCPALLGNLSVHNEFIDAAVRRGKRTWNPITKVAMHISRRLSEARLYSDMNELTLNMQDCDGTMDYPVDSTNPTSLCGLGVRDAIAQQITSQPVRTQ